MERQKSKPARTFRDNYRLMDPAELTPEERWDLIVELLAEMCLAPESKPDNQPTPS